MATLAIPGTVRIGPYRFAVVIEPEPFVADGARDVLSGEIDHNHGKIRVVLGSPERMFTTLWHEVLHGIDDVAGTDLSEDTINRLAPVLAAVLMDNGYVERT